MGPFVDPGSLGLDEILIVRRFGVDQGAKIRACDDESANSCNAHCLPTGALDWDGADGVASVGDGVASAGRRAGAQRLCIIREEAGEPWTS